jgi:hypothetical protein
VIRPKAYETLGSIPWIKWRVNTAQQVQMKDMQRSTQFKVNLRR